MSKIKIPVSIAISAPLSALKLNLVLYDSFVKVMYHYSSNRLLLSVLPDKVPAHAFLSSLL